MVEFMNKYNTFESWMAAVNQHIESSIGLSADDLPDCCYHDWYDDGIPPAVAARRVIKNAND